MENTLKSSSYVQVPSRIARALTRSHGLGPTSILPSSDAPASPTRARLPCSGGCVQVPLVHAESTKSYCIALICPTPAVRALANDAGLAADTPWANVCANETVTAAVLADLQAVCAAAKLNKNTTPQKCVLIDDEFSPENDMMTAVRKLKRKPIANKHAAQIAKVYV